MKAGMETMVIPGCLPTALSKRSRPGVSGYLTVGLIIIGCFNLLDIADAYDECSNAQHFCEIGSSLCQKYQKKFKNEGTICPGVNESGTNSRSPLPTTSSESPTQPEPVSPSIMKDAKGCGTPVPYVDPHYSISWTGKCKGGLLQGRGVLLMYKDSALLHRDDGTFENGLQQGRGSRQYPENSSYIGGFKNGFMDGDGKLTINNGSTYEGDFKFGKKDGHGNLVFGDGTKYEGQFKEDRMEGIGIITYKNGGSFDGYVTNGVPNGYGTLRSSSGSRYVGNFVDGRYDGHGTLTATNGTSYDGEFKNGRPNGFGTYKYGSGAKYQGDVKDGRWNGQGIAVLANGQRYEGQFVDNVFQDPESSGNQTDILSNAEAHNEQCAWGLEHDRDFYAALGCDPSQLANAPPPEDRFAAVHEMQAAILNSSQRRTTVNPSAGYTPPSQVPAYATQNTASRVSYDSDLKRCASLGGDGQSVYFQNSCNAPLTIAFYQPAGIGAGATDCGSGARCTFGAFGIGYSANNRTSYAVCPQGDYIESAPGVQWSGTGPFRCRRP